MKTLGIRIKGKVQGVFYRRSALEKAQELNITGKVRNEPDDSVYIIATGEERALEEFTSWCRQGPSGAKVESIECRDLPFTIFHGFSIER